MKGRDVKDVRAETRMKDILRERISGVNNQARIVGGASLVPGVSSYYTEKPYLSDPEHHAAIAVWESLKKNELEAEVQRRQLEIEQQKLMLIEEQQRAQIAAEQARIEIQRAEIIVRALEVAARAGVSGDRILTLIVEGKIPALSGPVEGQVEVPDTLQIEDKTKVVR